MMHCIPRAEMPQVDQEHLDGLQRYMKETHGIQSVLKYLPVSLLVSKQCPIDTHPTKRADVMQKPILVTMDMTILDGNSRYYRMVLDREKFAHTIEFYSDFDTVREKIMGFAGAYQYGDGHYHPESF